jgi:hypothetical protein
MPFNVFSTDLVFFCESSCNVAIQLYNQTKGQYIYNETIVLPVGYSHKKFSFSTVNVSGDSILLMIGKDVGTFFILKSSLVYSNTLPNPREISNIKETDITKLKEDVTEIFNWRDDIVAKTGKFLIKGSSSFVGKGITFDANIIALPFSPGDVLMLYVESISLPPGASNNEVFVQVRETLSIGGNIQHNLTPGSAPRQIIISNNTITLDIRFYLSVGLISIQGATYTFNNYYVSKNGIIDDLEDKVKSFNDWDGKVLATYGDSVTASNNGDFTRPYLINSNTAWGNMVANHLKFTKQFGRGIGGQRFAYTSGGGAVSWVSQNGNLINRLDAYNFDTWTALSEKVYPAGVTAEMVANGTAITIRGSSCSWMRITKMFPATMKDTVNVVCVMYHNDAGSPDTALQFIENSSADPEWFLSQFYNTYNGDYNISTVRGGIASTIMKLQAWMPNAIIVLCTPISGRGIQGQLNKLLADEGMELLASIVRSMARFMSIPLIDVYATDGINGLNRLTYISDGIHPYLNAGQKMVARAVIGGLKSILPNI